MIYERANIKRDGYANALLNLGEIYWKLQVIKKAEVTFR
jgi:hypothetical protein